jgi:hypothetical protein
MTEQDIKNISEKIRGLYKVNEEIIKNINEARTIPKEHLRLSLIDERPRFIKLLKYESKLENEISIYKKINLKIIPHIFDINQNRKREKEVSYETISNENTSQMEIAKKYFLMGISETVHKQLSIILKNIENIQVCLGTFNEFFITQESKFERVDKKIQKINKLIEEVYKEETKISELPLFLMESSILKKFLVKEEWLLISKLISTFEVIKNKIPKIICTEKDSEKLSVKNWFSESTGDIIIIFKADSYYSLVFGCYIDRKCIEKGHISKIDETNTFLFKVDCRDVYKFPFNRNFIFELLATDSGFSIGHEKNPSLIFSQKKVVQSNLRCYDSPSSSFISLENVKAYEVIELI